MKILLAEDDPNLGALLQEYLTAKGFEVHLAKNGNEALDMFLAEVFDFCILDVMMPKKDGFTLAKEIKSQKPEIPLIFLTAKSMKEDIFKGFEIGADDYINKPFDMELLLMRIKAISNRVQISEPIFEPIFFKIGIFEFEPQSQTLKNDDQIIKLTTKESGLLKLLCQNLNKPVSRSLALKIIWGDDSYFNARSMDVYVTKLRKFLKADPNIQILNLHGEGFKLLT